MLIDDPRSTETAESQAERETTIRIFRESVPIRETAQDDGPMVEIGLPQDPGQAGKSQAADMVLMLAGKVVRAEREKRM